jgi:predicted transcriptional regulator
MSTIKEEIRRLAEQLPEGTYRDEVRYEIYVRQKIADGETAIAEGRLVPHAEVEKRFTSA